MRYEPARWEAKRLGRIRYSTGKSCANGHLSERHTSTGKCVECHRLRRIRKYRANPAKERQKKNLYDLRNRELVNAKAAHRRTVDPDRHREAVRLWRERNPEKTKVWWSGYYARNCEQEKIRSTIKRKRRDATEGFFTKEDLIRIRKAQRGRCAMCRIKLCGKGHLDHIIAISKGGTNWPRNLQFLCRDCNLRKNAKDPLVFAREKGMLL